MKKIWIVPSLETLSVSETNTGLSELTRLENDNVITGFSILKFMNLSNTPDS